MSVYTHINQQQLQAFLSLYSLGDLVHFSGIQAGIENTNYAVTTSQGDFILTIFETFTAKQLTCFLNLLDHLCQNTFPAPKPQLCITGELIKRFNNKPAAVFNRLAGCSVDIPSIKQCAEVGEYLAKLHLSSIDSDFNKANPKNLAGCQSIFNHIKTYLTQDEIDLAESEFSFQSAYSFSGLSKGVIHADLFKDNVLFNQGHISGIVDFYTACCDYFLLDIAIACNDWCVVDAEMDQKKLKALLSGYQKTSPMAEHEIKQLTAFLRFAALRFWLSRVEHQIKAKASELTIEKDPLVFRRLLEYHRTKAGGLV